MEGAKSIISDAKEREPCEAHSKLWRIFQLRKEEIKDEPLTTHQKKKDELLTSGMLKICLKQ